MISELLSNIAAAVTTLAGDLVVVAAYGVVVSIVAYLFAYSITTGILDAIFPSKNNKGE